MKRVMIASLALTLLCVVCAPAQTWPEEKHYKVYIVEAPFNLSAPIRLNDQFGDYFADHELCEIDLELARAHLDLDERDEARRTRDFARADRLRDQIQTMGWEVMDTPHGSTVRPLGVEA